MPFQHFDVEDSNRNKLDLSATAGWSLATLGVVGAGAYFGVGRNLLGVIKGRGVIKDALLSKPSAFLSDIIDASSLLSYTHSRMRGLSAADAYHAIMNHRGLPTAGGVTLRQLRANRPLLDNLSPTLRGHFEQALSSLNNLTSAFGGSTRIDDILDTAVPGFSLAGGRLKDNRFWQWSTIPHVLESLSLPRAPSFPFVGAQPSMQSPLKWFADLLFPTDILREQRHFQVFLGPKVGRVGSSGGTRYLMRSGQSGNQSISRVGIREWDPRSAQFNYTPNTVRMPERDTNRLYRVSVTPLPELLGEHPLKVIPTSGSLGRGARIRMGAYSHDVNAFLDNHGIDPASKHGRILKWLDSFGVGPHLTSPTYDTQYVSTTSGYAYKYGDPQVSTRHGKLGLVQRLLAKIYNYSGQDPPFHIAEPGTPTLLGDTKGVWTQRPGLGPGGLQFVSDFYNYLVMRPMALVEELTGMGIRGGETPVGSAYRILTRAAFPAWAGIQAASYVDYKSRQLTGFSPSDLVLAPYAGVQITVAAARDFTGVTQASNYLEDMFPGIISSPLSMLGRTWGLGYLGARAGGALPGPAWARLIGPVAGAALGGTIGLGDPRETADKLRRVYSGKQDVPIRRSRWWELGRDSYFGRDIHYFRPHAMHLFRSKYWQKAIYGSESEYWSYGTMFPTPENLFGLLPLISPNYAEEKNLYSRPYPIYGGMGGDIPIIGPTIQGITGELMQEKHPLYRESMRYQSTNPGSERGYDAAARLSGVPGVGLPREAINPTSVSNVIGGQLSNLQDFIGMPGFVFGALKAKMFGGGRDLFQDGPMLQSSSRMTSTERWFYESLNIGGGLFQSEPIRRFIPRRNTQREEVNPIPNQMPVWLPGSNSIFERDRDFYVDLHKGDPYCVSADTLIETVAGLRRADTIMSGQLIRSHLGRWLPVKRTIVRSVDDQENCYRIVLQGLSAFPITASEEHPFYHLRSTGVGKKPDRVWTEACALKKGDRLLLPLPIPVERYLIDFADISNHTATKDWVYVWKSPENAEIYEWLECNGASFKRGVRKSLLNEKEWSADKLETEQRSLRKKCTDRAPRYIEVDEQLGYLLGVYAAEGVAANTGRIGFSLHNKESDIRSRLDPGIAKFTDRKARWHQRGNGGEYIVGSVLLSDFLRHACPGNAKTKTFADWVLRLPDRVLLSVIRGLLDGDGWIQERGARFRLGLKTISASLVYQTWLALARLGFRSTVSGYDPPSTILSGNQKPTNFQKAYTLQVNGTKGRRCASALGYDIEAPEPTKETFLRWRDGYFVVPIQQISSEDCSTVYGFEVDEDDSFCVAGVATHNTKVPVGEVRLPGPGYESVRPLHSGTPGVYDAVDRFLILADVAPFSDAFRHYKTIVDMWMKAGVLDNSWTRKVIETKAQLDEKMESRQFGTPNLAYSPELETIAVTPTKVLGGGRFKVQEFPDRTFQVAGIQGKRETAVYNVLASANANTVEQARSIVETQQSRLKQAMSQNLNRTISVQIARDQASRYSDTGATMALVPGLSQEFFDSPIGDKKQLGVAGHLRGSPLLRGASNAYYNLVTQQPPYMFGWAKNKLLPIRTPLQDYKQFNLQMSRIGDWENPVSGFLGPWATSTIDWFTPGDYVPQSARDRQELQRRFDAVKYIKMQKGLQWARSLGDGKLIDYFKGQMARTPAGLNTYNPRQVLLYGYGSVPNTEKWYVNSLSNLQTTEERERALNLASPALGNVLMAKWRQRLPFGESFESDQMKIYNDFFSPRKFSNYALSGVVNSKGLPGEDWVGWDPRVSLDAAKLKFLERTSEDIHNFGLWENQRRQYAAQFPDLEAPDFFDMGEPTFANGMQFSSQNDLRFNVNQLFGYGIQGNQRVVYQQNRLPSMVRSFRDNDFRFGSRLYAGY